MWRTHWSSLVKPWSWSWSRSWSFMAKPVCPRVKDDGTPRCGQEHCGSVFILAVNWLYNMIVFCRANVTNASNFIVKLGQSVLELKTIAHCVVAKRSVAASLSGRSTGYKAWSYTVQRFNANSVTNALHFKLVTPWSWSWSWSWSFMAKPVCPVCLSCDVAKRSVAAYLSSRLTGYTTWSYSVERFNANRMRRMHRTSSPSFASLSSS